MGCCVAAALVIYQLLLFRDRMLSWFGRSARSESDSSAAFWSPGQQSAVARPVPQRLALPRRLLLAAVCELLLVAYVGLHWNHIQSEVRTAGSFLGIVAPPSSEDGWNAAVWPTDAECGSSRSATPAAPLS